MRFLLILCLLSVLENIEGQTLKPDRVLARLIKGRGEMRDDYPTLKIVNRVKNIAAYAPSSNMIILENKAIEVCQAMGEHGEDALAFLIAHELTHYFQHRLWMQGSEEISFFATADRFEEVKHFEIEADTYGAFLCYLAGYNYAQVAPEVILKLYEAYQIDPTQLIEYPSPRERMSLTLSVCQQVEEYRLLFEAAQVLEHFGAYNWSQVIHNYLLKFLDFKEIHNNAAVNELKLAMANLPEEMQYPLIVKRSLALRSSIDFSVDSLLSSALEHLQSAVRKDPTDHEVFINLASLFVLRKDYESYEELSAHLKKINLNQLNKNRLQVVKGIATFRQGNEAEARSIFQSTRKETNKKEIKDVCLRNLDFMSGRNGKKSNKVSYDIPIFSPTSVIAEPIVNRLSEADPLFPKIATLQTAGDRSQITLSNGLEKVTLWMEKSLHQTQVYRNKYRFELNGEARDWYIQGLDGI